MSGSFGSTVSSGVQDVSAILPLMGTEQCESHVTSGLQRGFLYPAASILSIFGSLGIAKAGLKIFVASSDFRLPGFPGIHGAQLVKNAGFGGAERDGLSTILLNAEGTFYGVEEQVEERLQNLSVPIQDLEGCVVETSSINGIWFTHMILWSAWLSIAGIVPYIHLNVRGNSNHPVFLKWFYPCSRILGSFLVATCGQWVIQRQILRLIRRKLMVEASLKPAANVSNLRESLKEILHPKEPKATNRYFEDLMDDLQKTPLLVQQAADQSTPDPKISSDDIRTCWPLLSIGALRRALWEVDGWRMSSSGYHIIFSMPHILWLYLPSILLLIGCALIVVGYIGCFSIVQGATNAVAPLIWLGIEVFLSLVRMILWASNPAWDEKTGFHLKMTFKRYLLLPTCTDYAIHLQSTSIYPVTEWNEFLQRQLSLYLPPDKKIAQPTFEYGETLLYTLTRESPNDPTIRLYITICDKDRERVFILYLEEPENEDKPSTVLRGTLTDDQNVRAGEKLTDRGAHTLSDTVWDATVKHYRSIFSIIKGRTFEIPMKRDLYLAWTMHLHPDAKPSSVSPKYGTEIEDYLLLGDFQRDQRFRIARMSEWLGQYLSPEQFPRIQRAIQEASSESKAEGTQVYATCKPQPLSEWLRGLEGILAEAHATVENELLKEYDKRLIRTLETMKDPAQQNRLRDQLLSEQKRHALNRFQKVGIDRERLFQQVPLSFKDIWGTAEGLIRDPQRDLHDPRSEAQKLMDSMTDLGPRHSPIEGIVDQLVKYLESYSNWEDYLVPPDSELAFMTRNDLRHFVINSKTVMHNPDLVLRRNHNLRCVVFDIDLQDPEHDAIIQSCIEFMGSRPQQWSVNFGERGLQGATRRTIEAIKTLVASGEYVYSVWFCKGAKVFNSSPTEDGDESDLKAALDNQLEKKSTGRRVRSQDSMLFSRITYEAGVFIQDPDQPTAIGGSESRFLIEFLPAPSNIDSRIPHICLMLRGIEDQKTSVKLVSNQALFQPIEKEIQMEGRSQWKTESFAAPIPDSALASEPEGRTQPPMVELTVKGALVADVWVELREVESRDAPLNRLVELLLQQIRVMSDRARSSPRAQAIGENAV